MADGEISIDVVVEGAADAKAAFGEIGAAVQTVGNALAAAGQALVAISAEFSRQRGIWSGFQGDISQTRDAMGGLISDIEIMRRGNEMAARGIQLSGRDMRNVFVAANQEASRTGEQFNQVLDRMVQALGTNSQRAFRQFGSSARDATGFLEELETQVGDTKVAAENATDIWTQFKTAVDNGVTTFFQAVEVTGELERTINTIAHALGLGDNAMQSFATTMREQGIRWAAHFTETLSELREDVKTLVNTWNEARRAIASGDVMGAVNAVRRGAEQGFRTPSERLAAREARAERIRAGLAANTPRDRQTVVPPPTGGGRGRGRREEDPFSDENYRRAEADMDEVIAQGRDDDIQQHREKLEAREEAEREAADAEKERHRERMERMREFYEEQEELREDSIHKMQEANRKVAEDAEGVLGPVVSGITKSLAEVAAGTKTADQAFQGLLSSFLEMIAQETALQAAKEFAEAIASFARYDYSGGAQHIAAGVAYTAVAVAAGAASIAVAPPAATPASPEQSAGGGQQGGNSYTINISGTIATAATHAELGRELKGYLDAADSRYGAAA